jgi:hypothetical protein
MSDKSLPALLGFLDWMATKGLMQRNTVSGRKAACSKVLGVLDPEEQADVTQVSIDDAMDRFQNLEGRNYMPASLGVYRSRVAAAISDFERYLANPASFKPGVVQRRTANGTTKRTQPTETPQQQARAASSEAPVSTAHSPVNVFPIPIRADVVVRIHGLPFDLTVAEADKIANIVKAMAMA